VVTRSWHKQNATFVRLPNQGAVVDSEKIGNKKK
jgi:hypothetical protein